MRQVSNSSAAQSTLIKAFTWIDALKVLHMKYISIIFFQSFLQDNKYIFYYAYSVTAITGLVQPYIDRFIYPDELK